MLRILTGLVLIPSFIALVLFGPLYLIVAAQLAIALLGVWEYFHMASAAGLKPQRVVGYLFAFLLSLIHLSESMIPGDAFVLLTIAALMIAMTFGMRASSGLGDYVGSVAATLFGPIYVALPLTMLVWVWMQSNGPHYVLFVFLVVWTGDTAGYFVGKYVGRHKSSPHISPNKTWEGTIASFVAALLVAATWITVRKGSVGYGEAMVLAACLNIAGQTGDLVESAMKRSVGVKDSSHLVPGHGGVLDRIDALLFAAPIVFCYYWLLAARHEL